MNRLALLAASVTLVAVPTVAAAPAASAAPKDRAVVARSVAAPTLAARQTAALRLADTYAAQAPRVSWKQKAANADRLAEALNVPGISTQAKAIAIGKTQLGTQYRYGGTTPAGFDCSGFTGFAFRKAGKTLPRTAAMQQRAARKVTDPAPGDLVFFGGARAYHVGIYVGNGKMLHSPRTGKPVQIAKIYKGATYGRI